MLAATGWPWMAKGKVLAAELHTPPAVIPGTGMGCWDCEFYLFVELFLVMQRHTAIKPDCARMIWQQRFATRKSPFRIRPTSPPSMRSFLSCDQRRPHWGNLCLGFRWIPGLLGDDLLSFLSPFRELLFLRQNLKGVRQYHSSGKPLILWLSPADKFLPNKRDKTMITSQATRMLESGLCIFEYNYTWHLDVWMSRYVEVQYRSLRRCCILHLAEY